MKESGFNYFAGQLGLNTGSFGAMYTFEDGAGTNVSSVSGADPLYSGTLSSATNFWLKPGSGFSSGTTVTINNASGLHSEAWTKIFVFERVNVNPCILFDSLTGVSGHRIGVTKSNKLYFESFNEEPVVAASSNNYSSKNAVSVSYLTNSVTLGLYNFNGKTLESESFDYPFQVTRSDTQTLGGQFTGYWDYYIHRTDYLSPDVVGQWMSGLYARPTGYGFDVQTICVTGITGYQNVFVGVTGVTGRVITAGGDEGRDYFTGAFPVSHTVTDLTGYLSTGLYSSGMSGVACYPVTGAPTDLLEYLTGYASSFGMRKVQMFTHMETGYVTKTSWSYTPFVDAYNKRGVRNFSGYSMLERYPTGQINLYYNGIGQSNDGWTVSGTYLVISGTQSSDIASFDLKSGDKKVFHVTGLTGYAFTYTGQEIYLNGVNLISGYDYVLAAGTLNLTNVNTGITGYIFEYPIVLTSQTGASSLITGGPFWRNTSNVYINGVRQINRASYVEGATFDLLSGQYFDNDLISEIYDNNDFYWE